MASASRFKLAEDLNFVDTANSGAELGPQATRSNPVMSPSFPDEDYAGIAKELKAPGEDAVSYVVHAEVDKRGRKGFRLIGTFGVGEDYDPLQDPRALHRAAMSAFMAKQ